MSEFLKSYSFSSLLNRCKQAQIDGYSTLGAALIAKKLSDKEKNKFIRQLIECGFEFTAKDRELAIFEFYENIPVKQKKKMARLLSAFGQGDLFVLPHEVRKFIVHCMVRSYYNHSLVSLFS